MNPEIKRYLDQHGATYTPEALRKGLMDAGYDPAEVDAALGAWDAREAAGPDAEGRRAFGRWAFRLHLGALVGMFLLVVLLRGVSAAGLALVGGLVLAVALLIGWAISAAIGRALLPRTGLTIALIVPAISAIALGGACLGLMVASIQPPPRDGTVHLKIEAPRAFDGSGPAACYLDQGGGGGVQVNSQELGRLDGKNVSVSFSWSSSDATQPQPKGTYLSVILGSDSEAEPPGSYITIFSTTFEVDARTDSRSGTMQFDGLAAEPIEGPAGETPPEAISGSVSWTCE